MIKVNCYNVNYDSIDRFALMEWEAGRVTSRRFKEIVRTLFQYSCENGIDAKNLAAIVSDDSNILFSVTCISYNRDLEPSAIDASIRIHPHADLEQHEIRIMNIAS